MTAPLAQEQLQHVPLKLLDESPLNKRRKWGDLEELAQSMRSRGQLQPGLARPKAGGRFELAAGHRRKRALALAGIDTMALIVRPMNDAEMVEILAIENIQREDLDPLSEGECFAQLAKLGWSHDQIASRIGLHRTYIQRRLKLLELAPEAREAFLADRLSQGVALLLARVPQALQAEALKDLDGAASESALESFVGKVDGAPDQIGQRAAAALLQRRYMTQLANAPFDKGDEQLVPGAGACAACPSRSGNQTELFGDVASPDVCTNVVCFGEKRKAAAAIATAKLEAKCVRVLPGKERAYGGVSAPTGWVSLDEVCPETGKTYREMAKGKKVAMAIEMTGRVAMLDERNKPVDIVKRADVLEALGIDPVRASSGGTSLSAELAKVATARAAAELAAERSALSEIVKRAEAKGITDAALRAICAGQDEAALKEAGERRGRKAPIGRMTRKALAGYLVELLIILTPDLLEPVGKAYGVSLAAHTKKALADLAKGESA